MSRYRKLFLALAAVAALYIVQATGLDSGLVKDVLDALVDVLTTQPEVAVPAEVSVPTEGIPQ